MFCFVYIYKTVIYWEIFCGQPLREPSLFRAHAQIMVTLRIPEEPSFQKNMHCMETFPPGNTYSRWPSFQGNLHFRETFIPEKACRTVCVCWGEAFWFEWKWFERGWTLIYSFPAEQTHAMIIYLVTALYFFHILNQFFFKLLLLFFNKLSNI